MPLKYEELMSIASAIDFIDRSRRIRSNLAASPKGVSFMWSPLCVVGNGFARI
jgi:hypothetical protein